MELLFTRADEAAFVAALRDPMPELRLVSDTIWPTSEPPLVEDITTSAERYFYLWDAGAYPELPRRQIADGRWQGPAVGPVVQFERSEVLGQTLLAGSMTGNWGDELSAGFVNAVWSVARRLTVGDIAMLDGSKLPYRAGLDAIRWVTEDESRAFGAKNSPVLFLPRALLPQSEQASSEP
jgi:hypothetical protein